MFDDIIANMVSNKKPDPIVTDLLIRVRKLNISLAFITQSYFKAFKNVRLNSTHYFTIKIPIKRELQQTAINHSSDIDFRPWHDTQATARVLIVTRANQEKGGLGKR